MDEFFDIVDSHPMTDEEATDRLVKINPRNLPQFHQFTQARNGEISGNLDWINDYDDYMESWIALANATDLHIRTHWTAETRKRLVKLEYMFEDTAVNWLGLVRRG